MVAAVVAGWASALEFVGGGAFGGLVVGLVVVLEEGGVATVDGGQIDELSLPFRS